MFFSYVGLTSVFVDVIPAPARSYINVFVTVRIVVGRFIIFVIGRDTIIRLVCKFYIGIFVIKIINIGDSILILVLKQIFLFFVMMAVDILIRITVPLSMNGSVAKNKC